MCIFCRNGTTDAIMLSLSHKRKFVLWCILRMWIVYNWCEMKRNILQQSLSSSRMWKTNFILRPNDRTVMQCCFPKLQHRSHYSRKFTIVYILMYVTHIKVPIYTITPAGMEVRQRRSTIFLLLMIHKWPGFSNLHHIEIWSYELNSIL